MNDNAADNAAGDGEAADARPSKTFDAAAFASWGTGIEKPCSDATPADGDDRPTSTSTSASASGSAKRRKGLSSLRTAPTTTETSEVSEVSQVSGRDSTPEPINTSPTSPTVSGENVASSMAGRAGRSSTSKRPAQPKSTTTTMSTAGAAGVDAASARTRVSLRIPARMMPSVVEARRQRYVLTDVMGLGWQRWAAGELTDATIERRWQQLFIDDYGVDRMMGHGATVPLTVDQRTAATELAASLRMSRSAVLVIWASFGLDALNLPIDTRPDSRASPHDM